MARGGPQSAVCCASQSVHGDKPSTPLDFIVSSGSRLTKEHCVLKAPGLRQFVLVREPRRWSVGHWGHETHWGNPKYSGQKGSPPSASYAPHGLARDRTSDSVVSSHCYSVLLRLTPSGKSPQYRSEQDAVWTSVMVWPCGTGD